MSALQTAVEEFGKAALNPELWPRALDLLAYEFQSDGISLIRGQTSHGTVVVSTACAPFVSDYLEHMANNPREERVDVKLHQRFLPDAAFFSRREIANHPYYQEYLGPRGFGWNAVAALPNDLILSVKRGFRHASYDGAELGKLNDTLPWLRSASAMAVAVWESGFCGQLSAFERTGRGAILIDSRARVLTSNACVKFGDGLDTVDGVLQASRIADRPAFHRFLKSLMGQEQLNRKPTALSLTLHRPSSVRPLLLEGTSCISALRSFHSSAAALLLLTDSERPARADYNSLKALFQLTPTECRLALELVRGNSVRQAAVRLSISEGHARQRLQSIFHKTGTSRQGALVALLTGLV